MKNNQIAKIEECKVSIGSLSDQEIEAVRNEDGVWVSVRRICRNIGIDDNTQIKKLKGCQWACGGLIPSRDTKGRKQEQFMLHLSSVARWLAGIDVNRVNASIRPKLIAYQKEAADVLHQYFTTGKAVHPALAEKEACEAGRDLSNGSEYGFLQYCSDEQREKWLRAKAFAELAKAGIHNPAMLNQAVDAAFSNDNGPRRHLPINWRDRQVHIHSYLTGKFNEMFGIVISNFDKFVHHFCRILLSLYRDYHNGNLPPRRSQYVYDNVIDMPILDEAFLITLNSRKDQLLLPFDSNVLPGKTMAIVKKSEWTM